MSETISNLDLRTDEDAQKAILIIDPESNSGTGFLFHDSRHILTAWHVIDGMQPDKVKVHEVSNSNAPTKDYSARIQKIWEEYDIALLYLDEQPIQSAQPFTLSPKVLSHPMPIRTFGYPGIFGEGWHSAEIAGGPLNGKYEIDFNMNYPDTLGGLSGAPVFLSGDKAYSVVGVISNHGPRNFQKG